MVERYDSPNDRDVLDALRVVAYARGEAPAMVAMAWLLAKPGVTAPIVGATKLDHLQTAVEALSVRLSDDEMQALESPYRPHEVRGH
jgi:aryl-alcohol dehydrogenase-like predicted oxidoreductase